MWPNPKTSLIENFIFRAVYAPQLLQNMMGWSYMPTHLFQDIQNAQLHKQED